MAKTAFLKTFCNIKQKLRHYFSFDLTQMRSFKLLQFVGTYTVFDAIRRHKAQIINFRLLSFKSAVLRVCRVNLFSLCF